MRIKTDLLQLGTILFLGILLLPMNLSAIPALSRKYKTSCVTCHIIYPRLNQFGEAIRLNGYRWPGNREIQNTHEKPVTLGAQGYKQVWPNSIWPGAIPGTAPIAFRVRQGFDVVAKDDSSYPGFTQPELELMAGGTFGEDISFLITAEILKEGEIGEIEQAFLVLDRLPAFGPADNDVHLMLGQFIPEIVPFIARQRNLTINSYLFNTYAPSAGSRTVGIPDTTGVPFSFETSQLGLEVSGLVKGRLHYMLGLVNGNGADGNNNSAMDLYYRVAYKFGGLALDGERPKILSGEQASLKTARIGTFGYFGTATSGGQNVAFRRVGADFAMSWGDFNLFNGVITGTDEEYTGARIITSSYALFLSEGSYMFYPWLMGILRYEQAYPEELDPVTRLVPGITALYTANVKFILEASVNPADLSELTLQAGMDFAF